MSETWETFSIEAGGPGTGLLVPGRVLRALALGASVPAEDVGVMTPGRRGEIQVEIARHRAASIATPRVLPSLEGSGQRAALFVLRRADDDVDPDASRELTVSWDDGGAAPNPGELASALAIATGGAGEALGFGLAGATFLRVQVPLAMALSGLPERLNIGARVLRIEVDSAKKS